MIGSSSLNLNQERKHYLNIAYDVKSWLFTTDHKRIGMLYLFSMSTFLGLGIIFALLLQLEALTPAGDALYADVYDSVLTMHGVLMVFFFLLPSIPATLGNFLLPLMIGARNVAFPRLNLLGWHTYMAGGTLVLLAMLASTVNTGWTLYIPYISTFSNLYVVAFVLGALISAFSSVLVGINFIATTHKMRAPGLTWSRLPLFVWEHYATSWALVLGAPVLLVVGMLVVADGVFRVGIIDPALGGVPTLFPYLFWFYTHIVVYVMVLPALGVISAVISAFSQRDVVEPQVGAAASLFIVLVGVVAWMIHLFANEQAALTQQLFSFFAFLIAVPVSVKVAMWIITLYKGNVSLRSPLLFVLGALGLLVAGGATALFLNSLAIAPQLSNTAFETGQFHLVMVGGVMLAYLGGLHFWWPKITGRLYSERWGMVAALFAFLGTGLAFVPQLILGYLGMPQQHYVYSPEFQGWQLVSASGVALLLVALLLPGVYLLWSLFFGPQADGNPWQVRGLEWTTASPPPKENFKDVPVIAD